MAVDMNLAYLPSTKRVTDYKKRRSTSTSEESRMIYLQYKASRALELIPLTNHKGVVARLQYEHRIMTEEANTIAEKLITTNDITTYC